MTHDRCQAVFDALGFGVCLLSPDAQIEQVNRAMTAILGKSADELLGRIPQEVVPGLPPPSDACPFQRLRKSLRRESAELWLMERWFQVTADPVFDRQGRLTGSVVTMVDTSQQRLLEEQLRRSHKMEAIGRLAGVLAHNFSTLLTIISGYGHMVRDGLPPRDSQRKDLEAILEAADRATSLTRQLLTIGRRQPVHPRLLDLNRQVSGMARILHRVVGQRIQLALALHRPLGRLQADPAQIEQLIMNLVLNARDAMPRGGRLGIETARVRVSKSGSPGQPSLPPGQYVTLTITDTGTGMDAETTSHLFEPFFTTKHKRKGVGLGLPIVYGIVKQCRGDIEVSSEPGKGTSFRIFLPVWRPGRAAGPAKTGAPSG